MSRSPRPISLAHPVVAGYNGSASARNALAYAAGMARRLGRPLLMVYVTSPGVYCEPLTGQVVGLLRDADSLERWLLTELDQAGRRERARGARAHPARQPGAGTRLDRGRVQRRRAGDRRAAALLAPPDRLGARLAGPQRPLPGHRRPLARAPTPAARTHQLGRVAHQRQLDVARCTPRHDASSPLPRRRARARRVEARARRRAWLPTAAGVPGGAVSARTAARRPRLTAGLGGPAVTADGRRRSGRDRRGAASSRCPARAAARWWCRRRCPRPTRSARPRRGT